MKPSDVIREGRNVLMEREWGRGTLLALDGQVCALGALAVAAGREDDLRLRRFDAFYDDDSLARAVRYVSFVDTERIVDHLRSVYIFNDSRDTTLHDVLARFDKAEKIAEQAEANDA